MSETNNSRTTSSDSCGLSASLEPLTQEKIERFELKIKHILTELRETEEQYRKEFQILRIMDFKLTSVGRLLFQVVIRLIQLGFYIHLGSRKILNSNVLLADNQLNPLQLKI